MTIESLNSILQELIELSHNTDQNEALGKARSICLTIINSELVYKCNTIKCLIDLVDRLVWLISLEEYFEKFDLYDHLELLKELLIKCAIQPEPEPEPEDFGLSN